MTGATNGSQGEEWPGKRLGLPRDGVGSLAPVMSRFAARFADGMVLSALYLMTVLLRFALTREFNWGSPRPLQIAVAFAGALYEVAMIAIWGQTLGKMFFGIKVVSTRTGSAPSWGGSIRRSLLIDGPTVGGNFVRTSEFVESLPLLVFLADVLWALRDHSRQALHDKLAGTIVVREQRAVDLEARRASAW